MKEKCDALYQGLLSELESLDTALSPVELLKSSLSMVRAVIAQMRELVVLDGFATPASEVEFFKLLKPRVQALLVFATERYSYQTAKPLLLGELEAFHAEQLRFISRFFHQHEFLYQYYALGLEDLDEVYFIRGAANVEGMLGMGFPELDRDFATVGDYLFARFRAMELLRELVLSDMAAGESFAGGMAGDGNLVSLVSKKGLKLRWTGDTCNLIEVVYGLFDTKQLNEGQLNMSDIVDVFEQVFGVNLSRYFRRFSEIKRRKTVSKTKFLDAMVEAVNRRIDEGDAYVPMSMR
ncbi:RteC protein [compost metagenome]